MLLIDGEVHHDTHALPMGNYVIGVGNYVIVSPSELGNYKIADICQGLAYVGGDNEPAEDQDAPRPAARPVWKEPAARTLTVCRVCYGTRKVVNPGTGIPRIIMIMVTVAPGRA